MVGKPVHGQGQTTAEVGNACLTSHETVEDYACWVNDFYDG